MLTLVRGIPGSGKSTYAKKRDKSTHIEADMFFYKDDKYLWQGSLVGIAHLYCQSVTAYNLYRGLDVVVANTFTTYEEVEPYLRLAKMFDHEVKVVHCMGEYPNSHDVPELVVEKMRKRFLSQPQLYHLCLINNFKIPPHHFTVYYPLENAELVSSSL